MPINASNTVPKGAKLVKLVTTPVRMRWMPSMESTLNGKHSNHAQFIFRPQWGRTYRHAITSGRLTKNCISRYILLRESLCDPWRGRDLNNMVSGGLRRLAPATHRLPSVIPAGSTTRLKTPVLRNSANQVELSSKKMKLSEPKVKGQ